MSGQVREHCWSDVIPDNILEIYTHYEREAFVGERPALLAIDLYEVAYRGGDRPVNEIVMEHPSTCGENAWRAIPHTVRLFEAARAAGLPVFYSIGDRGPYAQPSRVSATRRQTRTDDETANDIRPEFSPQPGDTVIRKQRASAFYGTPLLAHLNQLGVQSLIICGQSTSGCVRATAVDGYSNGFHVTLAEECCFDRNILSHKINLFDLHHKYADVLHIEDIVAHLGKHPERAN